MPVDRSLEDEKNDFLQQYEDRDRQRDHGDPAFQAEKDQFLKAYGEKTYTPEPAGKPSTEASAAPVTIPKRVSQAFEDAPLSPLAKINQAFSDLPHARYTEDARGGPRWMPQTEGDLRYDYMMRHPEDPQNVFNLLTMFGPSRALGTAGKAAGAAAYGMGKFYALGEMFRHSPELVHLIEGFIP